MWCGVVWCGVLWCGVVWCGVVWCGVVWCGVVWCGVVCVWCGVVWCGVVWCGVVWCGVVWCGVVWCGVVQCALTQLGETNGSATQAWGRAAGASVPHRQSSPWGRGGRGADGAARRPPPPFPPSPVEPRSLCYAPVVPGSLCCAALVQGWRAGKGEGGLREGSANIRVQPVSRVMLFVTGLLVEVSSEKLLGCGAMLWVRVEHQFHCSQGGSHRQQQSTPHGPGRYIVGSDCRRRRAVDIQNLTGIGHASHI